MFHFPSTLSLQGSNSTRKSDGLTLNATQQKHATQPIFLEIEEDLHDARRVQFDGQEDDLRCALNMVISRVTQLSSMLSEAYKTQAELEVQLNVAKSNLKLVIANNEMLEDALKQNFSSQSKDVGWNRTSPRTKPESPKSILERSQSLDIPSTARQEPQTASSADVSSSSGTANPDNSLQDNRFFGFRFSSYTTKSSTRPGTPAGQNSNIPQPPHLTSPSLPSLTSVKSKEVENLTAELEKEKADRKKIMEEKSALEGELESLSQALFEEANKMVADERKMRADVEEELKELRKEKEALQSAMLIIEGENCNYRSVNASTASPSHFQSIKTVIPGSGFSHSRSSSRAAIKSRPPSLELASTFPLPPSPAPDITVFSPWYEDLAEEDDADKRKEALMPPIVLSPEEEQTPRLRIGVPGSTDDVFLEASPWADIPSKSAPSS